jgi:spore coat protein U-like protein
MSTYCSGSVHVAEATAPAQHIWLDGRSSCLTCPLSSRCSMSATLLPLPHNTCHLCLHITQLSVQTNQTRTCPLSSGCSMSATCSRSLITHVTFTAAKHMSTTCKRTSALHAPCPCAAPHQIHVVRSRQANIGLNYHNSSHSQSYK